MAEPVCKFKAAKAVEICSLFKLGDAAKELLTPEVAPLPFLEVLIGAKANQDAINFLAYGLPKREAVWWSCLCVRAADLPADGPLTKAAQAAETWVYRPSEESRVAAGKAADEAGTDHSAGWNARAAFWSGGSMGPPEAPPVPPAETLTAKAVCGAITMAAVRDPKLTTDFQDKFLASGLEIARGGTGRKALPDLVMDGA